VLLGLLMLLPLGYFVWRYPLPGNVRPSDLGYLSRYGKPELWAYLGGVAALFCLYLLALQETRRISPRRALPVVFGWSAVHAALMGFMFPATAIDIFVYFAYARVFTVFGDNPMAVYAQTYYYDPVIGKLSGEWGYHPSAYGPIWHLISTPISWASGENIPRAVTGYKLLAIVCLLLGGWLIARALAASRPQDAATGALLYLWNPLVLWEVAGNGHNDAVMLVPLLLASVAWTRRRDVWVLPLIGIAALIKFVAAPLLPVAAVALWRRAGGWPARRRLAVRTGALGAVALVLGLFPFYDLNAIRTSIADTNSLFVVSPANAIAHLLENTYPVPEVKRWLGHPCCLARRGLRFGVAAARPTATGFVRGVLRVPDGGDDVLPGVVSGVAARARRVAALGVACMADDRVVRGLDGGLCGMDLGAAVLGAGRHDATVLWHPHDLRPRCPAHPRRDRHVPCPPRARTARPSGKFTGAGSSRQPAATARGWIRVS
jgi:hypothetical protein